MCAFPLLCRLTVFAVAMYPTISDRILRTRDRVCEFVPSENPGFVIVLALLGHHVPCTVIIVSYVIVFVEFRKLMRTKPQDKFAASLQQHAKRKPNDAQRSAAVSGGASSVEHSVAMRVSLVPVSVGDTAPEDGSEVYLIFVTIQRAIDTNF